MLNQKIATEAELQAKAEKDAKKPFGIRDLFGYFMGDFGSNMSYSIIAGYMFIFYTQFVGIKLSHYAMIILVAKILDGIDDPIVGILIDKFTPAGRDKFKPLILKFAPVLSLSVIIMFINSAGFAYPAKVATCLLSYVLWDICYTLVNVPYGAMASVITKNSVERSQLSVARSFGSAVGGQLVTFVLPFVLYQSTIVDGKKASLFVGERTFGVAIALGIVGIIAFALCSFCSTERIKAAKVEDPDEPKERVSYFKALKFFVSNRAIVGVTIAGLAQILFILSANQLTQMAYQMYFHDGTLNAYQSFVTLVPVIFGILFGNFFVKKMGQKEAVSIPMLGTIAIYVLMLMFPVKNPVVWLVMQTIAQTFSFGLNVYLWGLLSDAIDYQCYISGERNEGIAYSTYTMMKKISQGIGQALIPMLIALFCPKIVLSDATTWLPQYALTIKNLSIVFPLIGTIVAFVAIHFIDNLTTEKVNQIHKEMEETSD